MRLLQFFLELDEITKIALLASSLGFSLDHSSIRGLTGLGHSALYDRIKALDTVIVRLSQARAELATVNIFEESEDVESAKVAR